MLGCLESNFVNCLIGLCSVEKVGIICLHLLCASMVACHVTLYHGSQLTNQNANQPRNQATKNQSISNI